MVLQHYYDKKDHVKRQIQTGGIYDLRRDIQAKINTVTKAGPAMKILLSSTSDLASNAMKIFEILIQYLVTEHIDYAVEIGLLGIPPAEPKVEPEIYFFDVVSEANTLFHLFEKQFTDSFIPLIMSSQHHGLCVKSKKTDFRPETDDAQCFYFHLLPCMSQSFSKLSLRITQWEAMLVICDMNEYRKLVKEQMRIL
ncbi:Exocyst complex component 5 [Bulinus truncatus]|nr:Exocyst complex component 5 [Bulinus truncatus]